MFDACLFFNGCDRCRRAQSSRSRHPCLSNFQLMERHQRLLRPVASALEENPTLTLHLERSDKFFQYHQVSVVAPTAPNTELPIAAPTLKQPIPVALPTELPAATTPLSNQLQFAAAPIEEDPTPTIHLRRFVRSFWYQHASSVPYTELPATSPTIEQPIPATPSQLSHWQQPPPLSSWQQPLPPSSQCQLSPQTEPPAVAPPTSAAPITSSARFVSGASFTRHAGAPVEEDPTSTLHLRRSDKSLWYQQASAAAPAGPITK
ncbi:hypothetical protein QYF36_025177 [Acer negundo]|nr:hypothetical protein QYF36_025177 [Acer negundo]